MDSVIIFDNRISKKTVSKLIGSLELMFTEYDKIELYFSSLGGDGFYSWVLIDYINKHKDKIKLILYGNIFSAGSIIAKYTWCEKQFLQEIVLMIHQANILDGNFKDLHKESNSSTWAIDQLNYKTNESFLHDIDSYLTEDEKELYSKGEDVYIVDQKRIYKILV